MFVRKSIDKRTNVRYIKFNKKQTLVQEDIL